MGGGLQVELINVASFISMVAKILSFINRQISPGVIWFWMTQSPRSPELSKMSYMASFLVDAINSHVLAVNKDGMANVAIHTQVCIA